MSLIIRAAARTLPPSIRDRYREQWLADARDAPEAGLRPIAIAFAALAFAVTFDHSLPTRAALTLPAIERRARIASAFALGAAVLGLAGFARNFGSSGFTGVAGFDLAIQLSDALLDAFAIGGSIVAIVVVTRTRAINARVRTAAWVLMIAAASPIVHVAVAGYPLAPWQMYLTTAGLIYLPGVIAVMVALRLLWTGLARPLTQHSPSLRTIVLSAIAVLATGALGFTQAALAWASRTPLSWSWQPGIATTMDADGTIVRSEIFPTQADYEQWLALNQQFETVVSTVFAVYAAITVLSLIAVVWFAHSARVSPGTLARTAIAILLIATTALTGLVDSSGWSDALVAPDLFFAAGRLLVVSSIIIAVGGVRYAPRAPRPDKLLSAAELL